MINGFDIFGLAETVKDATLQSLCSWVFLIKFGRMELGVGYGKGRSLHIFVQNE